MYICLFYAVYYAASEGNMTLNPLGISLSKRPKEMSFVTFESSSSKGALKLIARMWRINSNQDGFLQRRQLITPLKVVVS